MNINPDKAIVFIAGPVAINETLFFTWLVMALLTIVSALLTRGISSGAGNRKWQGLLETLVSFVTDQIKQVTGADAKPYLPFLGTLAVFILASNVLEVVPFYHAPTSSLSTTSALAVSVFFAVPVFGIRKKGVIGFLKEYAEPTVLMIPFNIISEFSRTVSLAVRLFGNMMSEGMIAAILLILVPLFVPVVMQLFGLVIGTVQAFIFFTLATVYIGSAAGAGEEKAGTTNERKEGNKNG